MKTECMLPTAEPMIIYDFLRVIDVEKSYRHLKRHHKIGKGGCGNRRLGQILE